MGQDRKNQIGPTPENPNEGTPQTKFEKMFASMIIRENWKTRANGAAAQVVENKSRYKAIEASTGVPWDVVGVIHLLEGSCNFGTHLHNGDSLKRRTVNVPAGRPKIGAPPFAWEISAIDALQMKKSIMPRVWGIDATLEFLERFNGLGYRKKGIETPYLWSGSQHYSRGKYMRDGVYDSNAVSQQVGAAVVLKVLRKA